MKKVLLALMMITFTLFIVGCEPTTTQVSINTNITQSTTSTTSSTYVAVTHIELILSQYEVCQGDQITLTVNITPTNASNQSYTITLSQTTYVDFVNSQNPLLLEAIASASTNLTETHVIATSDDNSSIDDTQQVYVHPPGSGGCPIT